MNNDKFENITESKGSFNPGTEADDLLKNQELSDSRNLLSGDAISSKDKDMSDKDISDEDISDEDLSDDMELTSESDSTDTGASDKLFNAAIDDKLVGKRLDKVLSILFPEHSRSYLKNLIVDGKVKVNDKPVLKASVTVNLGDVVELVVPPARQLDIKPEDIPLDILYEDDDVLVVNKPKDMVVHPAAGHYEGTLVNAIMYHCGDRLSGINGVMRPGIVHRIDKDTTGSIIICKNDNAHKKIAAQLKEHSIKREYVAIVYGIIDEDEGTIEGSIGRHPTDRKKMAMNVPNGKHAVTHFKVLKRFYESKMTYVACRLETGRTHQIRVHMSSIGHPLLGDEVYKDGRKTGIKLNGQCLHARLLGFVHPVTGQYVETIAPIPEYFEHLLETLK